MRCKREVIIDQVTKHVQLWAPELQMEPEINPIRVFLLSLSCLNVYLEIPALPCLVVHGVLHSWHVID